MDESQKLAAISAAVDRYNQATEGKVSEVVLAKAGQKLVERIDQALWDEDWREAEA